MSKLMDQEYDNLIISRGTKGSICKKSGKILFFAPTVASNIKDRSWSRRFSFCCSSFLWLQSSRTFSLFLVLAAAETISFQGNSKSISNVNLVKAVNSNPQVKIFLYLALVLFQVVISLILLYRKITESWSFKVSRTS